MAALGLCRYARAFSTCGEQGHSGLQCAGFSRGSFSRWEAQPLGVWAAVVAAHKHSGSGAWAWSLHGMWNLPGPEIEPMSPALAGGYLSTVPSRKSTNASLHSKYNT